MKRRRLLVVLLGVAAALAVFSLSTCDPFFFGTAFDSPAWISGDDRTRGRMVNDLFRSQCLVGLYRDEVVQLLGPPDSGEGGHYRYTVDIGRRFAFRKWVYWLDLEFEEGTLRVRRVSLAD